jgi:hypothetical protein
MSRGKSGGDAIAEDLFEIRLPYLGSSRGAIARTLGPLFGTVALLAACGGAAVPVGGAGAPAPNRHEFPLETRETVTLSPPFTGPDGRLDPEVIRGLRARTLGHDFHLLRTGSQEGSEAHGQGHREIRDRRGRCSAERRRREFHAAGPGSRGVHSRYVPQPQVRSEPQREHDDRLPDAAHASSSKPHGRPLLRCP